MRILHHNFRRSCPACDYASAPCSFLNCLCMGYTGEEVWGAGQDIPVLLFSQVPQVLWGPGKWLCVCVCVHVYTEWAGVQYAPFLCIWYAAHMHVHTRECKHHYCNDAGTLFGAVQRYYNLLLNAWIRRYHKQHSKGQWGWEMEWAMTQLCMYRQP